MLFHELFNKDPDKIQEEAHIIILDSKSSVCMDNNGNYTKNTRNISRRLCILIKRDKLKMHKID